MVEKNSKHATVYLLDVNIEISESRFIGWVWRKSTKTLVVYVWHKLTNANVFIILH